MSKKTAAKRKQKRKDSKKNGGSVMVARKKHNVVHLRDKLQGVYNMINLETTCCRQGVCCLVACPQMNYSEAMQILDRVWAEWGNEDKRSLIMKCLRFYFSNSMVKSCPLLGEDEAANPVEYLLAGLAGCVTTSLVAHAAARGVKIDSIESTLEGDIDLQGLLQLDEKDRKSVV